MEQKRIETNYILSFEKKVWCYAPVWGGEAQHKIEQKKGTNFASSKKQSIRDERTNSKALISEKGKRKEACYMGKPGFKHKEA